jgi:hypothetical protein
MAMGRPLSAAAAAGEDSNLFVTGIHPRLTEEDITVLFEKHGRVEKCNSPGHGATTKSAMATGMRLSASAAAAVIDGLVLLSIEPPWPWRGVMEHVMATGICLSTAAAATSARPVQPHWACRKHRHGGHLCHPCDSRAESGSLRCVLGEGLLVEFDTLSVKAWKSAGLWPTKSTRSPGCGVTTENATAGHFHPFENEQAAARPVVASKLESIDPLPDAATGQAEEGRIASCQNSTGGSAAAPRARSATTVRIPNWATHLSIDPRNTS